MRSLIAAFFAAGLIGTGLSAPASAQNVRNEPAAVKNKKESREAAAASSLYVISAQAGAVNYVSGKVAVAKEKAKSGYLAKGDTVEKGDRVKTGSDGKVEILLNPGSYVRLSENAEFKFGSTSLDNLQVDLNAGSAIFEVIAFNDFNVVVNTPKSSFQLVKSGIYRVDALNDGSGKISVWKGKAKYGAGKTDVVKSGQTAAAAAGGALSVQKFDRSDKGEFEAWSKDRAKQIAAANARLQQKAMSRSLISSFAQGGYDVWGRSNRTGLWVYDPFSSGFSFLPFGYGFSSPYGFNFNRTIWDYRLPNAVYNNINPNWNNPANQNNNSNIPAAGTNPANGGNAATPANPATPPAPARSEPAYSSPMRDTSEPGMSGKGYRQREIREQPQQIQKPIDR